MIWLWTGVLVAGGTTYVSVKVYNKGRRKKSLIQVLQPALEADRGLSSRFQEMTQSPMWRDFIRGPVLKDLQEATTEAESKRVEQLFDRYLMISALSCLAGFARFISPPFVLLNIIGILYVSIPRLYNAWEALKTKNKIHIDTLYAFYLPIGLWQHAYIVVSLYTSFYSLSGKMMALIKHDVEKNLVDIFRQQPRVVHVLQEEVEHDILLEDLQRDDIVVVYAGERIPVDGEIVSGLANIDQQTLTGEAQPIEKGIGDQVFAATLILMGRICIKTVRTGSETMAAEIGQILNQTLSYQSSYQLWAQTFSTQTAVYTFIIGSLALPFIGLLGTIAVYDAHFGYRLLIITPLSALTYFQVLANYGVLVKDGRTLELLSQVDTVVFDKTGTLTQSQPQVGMIYSYTGMEANEILAYAAAAERRQNHPIAQAILEKVKARRISVPPTEAVDYRVGYGLKVVIEQKLIRVGSLRFMDLEKIRVPHEAQAAMESSQAAGYSMIFVALEDQLVGSIELQPSLRPEVKTIIQGLRDREIDSFYIISGDQEAPTKKLAESLDIEHYYAEILPHQKAEIIAELQAAGKVVCFVGDGINDAIALKKAQVSISLSGASSAAVDTAQIVLMDETLTQLCRVFDLGQDFKRTQIFSTVAIVIPYLVGIVGSLFFAFNITATLMLKIIATSSAAFNARLPLWKHPRDKEKALGDRVEK